MKTSDRHATLTWIGVALLGIPLLFMLFGQVSSPVPLLVCLPIGLGLIMWGSAEERAAKIGVITFAVGLMVVFVGMGANIALLIVIGGIATAIGAFSWGLLKD